MPLPPAFRVTETGGTLRIEWSNRDVAKEGGVCAFLLVFWVVWTALTVSLTAWVIGYLFFSPFDFGWYCVLSPCGSAVGILVWYGVFAIPRAVMRRWGEAIEVSPTAITHTRTGWLAPWPRAYPLRRVSDFALGWYQNGPSRTANHVWLVGLYVNWKDDWGGRVSYPVGEWLPVEQTEQVFEVVRRFVADSGHTLTTTVWGEGPTERMARLRTETRTTETPGVPLPPEFRVTETDGTLRIEWDNRRVAHHTSGRLIGVAAVLLGLGAVLWTYKLFAELTAPSELRDSETLAASAFNFPFWWAFALVFTYMRVARTWVECIAVGHEAVRISRTGWLAPKPAVYPLARVEKLALAWNGTFEGDSDGSDSISLLLFRPGKHGPNISQVAWWLTDPVKHQFYLTIRDFAIRNNVPLAFDEWGTRPEWAKPSAVATKPE